MKQHTEQLIKLIEKYGFYPEKVIFAKYGFGWIGFDLDHPQVEIKPEDYEVLEQFGSGTVIVYYDGHYWDVCVEIGLEEKPYLKIA